MSATDQNVTVLLNLLVTSLFMHELRQTDLLEHRALEELKALPRPARRGALATVLYDLASIEDALLRTGAEVAPRLADSFRSALQRLPRDLHALSRVPVDPRPSDEVHLAVPGQDGYGAGVARAVDQRVLNYLLVGRWGRGLTRKGRGDLPLRLLRRCRCRYAVAGAGAGCQASIREPSGLTVGSRRYGGCTAYNRAWAARQAVMRVCLGRRRSPSA